MQQLLRVRRAAASALGIAVLSGLFALTLAGALFAAHRGDVSGFVHAAPPATDSSAAPNFLTVQPAADGFDGEFYYRLAVKPLSTDHTVDGVALDSPAMRSQRIVYPVLAALVGGADASRIRWGLVAVNVLALTAVGYLGARVAIGLGRAPAWGLLFAAYPGFVYTIGFDLVELTEVVFVLCALVALRRDRHALAAAALVLACLTKETGMILPFGLGLAWVWRRVRPGPGERPPLAAALPAVVPAAVFTGWQLLLRSRFDVLPLRANADNNLRFPLTGLLKVNDRFVPTSGENLFRDISLALVIGVAALALAAWRHSDTPLGVRVAWLGSIVMFVFLSEFVWDGATSFMRAGAEGYVLGLTVILGSDLAVTTLLVPTVGAVSALTIGSELAKAR